MSTMDVKESRAPKSSLLVLRSFEYSSSSRRKKGPRITFPMILYKLLQEVELYGQSDVISWQPHGKAFIVHDPKEFEQELMPAMFRQTRYASFQRQLNLYGFKRLYRGADKGGYYHRAFIRGKETLLHSIVRVRVKGTKVRQPIDLKSEPNFYLSSKAAQRCSIWSGDSQTEDPFEAVCTVLTNHLNFPSRPSKTGGGPQTIQISTDKTFPKELQNPMHPSSDEGDSTEEDHVISDDPTELKRMYALCMGHTLDIDGLDDLPMDDSGWIELFDDVFEEKRDYSREKSDECRSKKKQVSSHHSQLMTWKKACAA